MNRVGVIQEIADQIGARTYLEIGVQSGDTLFPLKIRKKIAVDPRFAITVRAKFNWIRWNFLNVFNEYYSMTSDAFFAEYAKLPKGRKFHVVFVDGLHTFEQSLRDVENSLRYLNENGVIIVDDCNPQSAPAANPIKEATQMTWNGDVWKTIVFLRATRPDLNVFTLNCVYGLGIVTRREAESLLDYSRDQVSAMTFDDLRENRERVLNLKPASYLDTFLGSSKKVARD